ncbi:SRPBCC family protein [Hoeflea prorocentri]|uniref:SRPBCC family protein n=1 Tax=Hoeflea prorocentri TaxID=1922333 RepID=A0A9X3UNM9_9HYPH|nr:SRPBCC family protein [Hoeflea prorocentri]MCY6382564.1 SRPBCC family protein [Hoeflea prorocentri]MDA5400364.1 SRPBCC family protein [Hoeflea prorocentri]
MIRAERSLEIDAAPEVIWGVLGQFMEIDAIAPGVTSVDALTQGEDGMGSMRRCTFTNGGSTVEEAQAEIALTPLGESRTRVTWSMDFRVKFGPLGWLMGQMVMKPMMGKVLDGNLQGLADKVRAEHAQAA